MSEECQAKEAKTEVTKKDEPTTKCEAECFCDRDFTVEEVKAIVFAMRKTEYKVPTQKDKDELAKLEAEDVELNELPIKVKEASARSDGSSEAKKELADLQKRTAELTKKAKARKERLNTLRRQASVLFFEPNCPLPDSDKTYDQLTDAINKACTAYTINTCIRKVHFLAQIYWEGDRFATTLEYESGVDYNPSNRSDAKAYGNAKEGDGPRYRGRGLMQLTWRKNYKRYFAHLIPRRSDLFPGITTAELALSRTKIFEEAQTRFKMEPKLAVDYAGLVANNLFVAVDSAGWFWNYGVVLNNGSALDLNTLADKNDEKQERISVLVNGGGNGKAERKTYYFTLKNDVFNVKGLCKNYKE